MRSGSTFYQYGNDYHQQLTYDSACWTALRTGQYVLPQNMNSMDKTYNVDVLGNSTTYASVEVKYTTNCTQYVNTTTSIDTALKEFNGTGPYFDVIYQTGGCILGTNVVCLIQDPQEKQCRMNVRMQAAFILAGCLFIKAFYMIALNYRARFRTKEHCLTFGDVIVASVLDPDLKIKNGTYIYRAGLITILLWGH